MCYILFILLTYVLFILGNHKECGSRYPKDYSSRYRKDYSSRYRKDCGLCVLDSRKDCGLYFVELHSSFICIIIFIIIISCLFFIIIIIIRVRVIFGFYFILLGNHKDCVSRYRKDCDLWFVECVLLCYMFWKLHLAAQI